MATIVVYNDIVLRNVVTREWRQEVIYDPSGTDQIASRFHLRFEGILHAQNPTTAPAAIVPQVGSNGDLAGMYSYVESRLSQPRAALLVSMVDAAGNSQTLLSAQSVISGPHAPNQDVDNGPKPTEVSITRIAGNQLFRVQFAVTCMLSLGPCSQPATYGTYNVLDNRWTMREVIDEKMFITRTIRGTIRLSNPSVTPDMVAALAVPALENGFKRDRIDFATTPSGLEVEYEVVDRQVHTAAPWPATKIDVVHSESTNDGMTVLSAVRARLEGHPGANKGSLFALGQAVCEQYLGSMAQITAGAYIESASFVDYIGEANAVEVSLVLRTTIGANLDGNEAMANIGLRMLGMPLTFVAWGTGQRLIPGNYQPTVSVAPPINGFATQAGDYVERPAAWAVLRCYLQSPFVDIHGIGSPVPYQVYPGVPASSGSGGYTEVSGTETPTLPATGSINAVSAQQTAAPYHYARVAVTYHNTALRVQLPIAYAASDAPVDADTSFVAKLGLGQARMEIDYDVERSGALPEIPPAKDTFMMGTITATLLSDWVRPMPPTIDAGKRIPIYRIAVHYVYALSRQPTGYDRLAIGQLPFVAVDQDRIVNAVSVGTMVSDRLALDT